MEPKNSREAKAGGRRFPLHILTALFGVLLAACSASEPARPALTAEDPGLVLWPRAEKAVRLRFTAGRDLNVYDDKAHSLQICVYQMDKPDAFLDLAKTQEGLAALLRAEAFDQSVKNATRLFLQPFETAVFELDRAEKATYVGIVGGYFNAVPGKTARIWEIKPHTEKTGLLFKTKVVYSAGTFDLALRFAADSMAEEAADGAAEEGRRNKAGSKAADKQGSTGLRWVKQETE